MDHMEFSIALPPFVELTHAGVEWTKMNQRLSIHLNPNLSMPYHQATPNLSTAFLINIALDQVQEVFNMNGLSIQETVRFNKILKIIEDICLPRFLIIYNRYRFFTCKQNGPEFNGFLQQLLAWSDLCEFGDLKDILLKDCIISGIAEESIRQHLLRTEQLDFNKTVEICKAGLVKKQRDENQKAKDSKFKDVWTLTDPEISHDNTNDKLCFHQNMLDEATNTLIQTEEKETQIDPINFQNLEEYVQDEISFNKHNNDFAMEREGSVYHQMQNVELGSETSQCDAFSRNGRLQQCQPDTLALSEDIQGEEIKIFNQDTQVEENVHDSTSAALGNLLELNSSKSNSSNDSHLHPQSHSHSHLHPQSLSHSHSHLQSLSHSHSHLQPHSHSHLQSHSQSQLIRDDKKFDKCSNNDNYNSYTKCGQVVKELKCSTCNDIFQDTISLNNHKKLKHSLKKTPEFKCESCLSTFKSAAHLKVHSRLHTGERPFVCDTCGKGYAEASKLKAHIRNHTGERPYACTECSMTFKWSAAFNRHKRTHTGERPYKCDTCSASFPDITSCQRHMRTHTKDRPYMCMCGSSFTDPSALRVHKRIHTGERPHSCSICGASFIRAQHLKEHTKLHAGERPYECDTCHSSFSEASKLKSHMRKHTGEKPYLCKICGKSFSWTAAYNRHLRTHTQEKPYVCRICGCAFADNSTFVRHRRSHTGERPFHCTQCSSTFGDSSSLRRHMKIHSREKTFICDVCGASFVMKSYLKRHVRIHSEDKRFECDVCPSKFSDASKLKRHKKIHAAKALVKEEKSEAGNMNTVTSWQTPSIDSDPLPLNPELTQMQDHDIGQYLSSKSLHSNSPHSPDRVEVGGDFGNLPDPVASSVLDAILSINT